MAKQKKKKQIKEQKPKDNQKKLKVPPIGIVNNIVYTEREVWAYYILSEKPYYFLSVDAKLTLANATMAALSSLCQSADKKVDCHLLITNQPFDPYIWEEDIREKEANYNKKENIPFNMFLEEQVNHLVEENYKKRVTYLGIKLFNRGQWDISSLNPLEFGFKDAIDALRKSISQTFQFNAQELSLHEETRMREAEEETYRNLANSSLQVTRPTAEECLLTIKRRFYPAMPNPYLETNHEERVGLSDIVIETGGVVEIKPRFLKINQVIGDREYTSYRAAVSFSKLPNELFFPSSIPPFLHRASMLPFTVNSRFTLVPTEHMKKELHKKKQDTEDEINNLVQSGQGATESLRSTVRDQQQLEKDLEDENLPWLAGNYRLIVETETEDQLKSYIANLKQEYSESDFVLTWTSGDQLLLFYEEFLGGKLEMNAFTLTTNMALLGIAGINYGGRTGDPVKQKHRVTKKK